MKDSIRIIRDNISGERIFTDIKEITNFHRIQASTGYRAAAEHIVQKLRADGLACEIRSYPFDEKTWYLASKSFLEWDCKDAWCELVAPERKRIADFKANNIAVIQKSFPCDYTDNPLEIVMLDKGPAEDAYEGLDIKGKLIFVRDAFNPYMDWALAKRGALGIITDFMRELPGVRARADLYDVKNYTSFWWKDTGAEPNTFGFVLSPREGDELAAICKKVAAEHAEDAAKPQYPTALCKVDAKLYPGAVDVVEARLKGETDEEILVIAHLCHPRPSANDNASGVACSMELLRVLKRLSQSGRIAPLRRGVRMIFVPEFSGTYAWLADEEKNLSKFVAGINLDMVGGRQVSGYGPITISAQPHAAPSVVTDMAALCLDEVKKNVISHNAGNYVAMFNHLAGEFTAGSDHYILTDPTIGIPTPMLGQWPDINYHTAADTVDCIDPFLLHKSASIAGGFVYAMANLSVKDVFELLCKTLQRCSADLTAIPAESMDIGRTAAETYERIRHYALYYKATCRDLTRFFTQKAYAEEVQGTVENFCASIDEQAARIFSAYLAAVGRPDFVYAPVESPPLYAYVPVRKFRAPILHLDDYAVGDEERMAAYKEYTSRNYKKVMSAHTFEAFVQYYMDGRRSLYEIAQEVILEARDGDVEFVHEFVQLLIRYGIVETL